jgi:hypothetical protein
LLFDQQPGDGRGVTQIDCQFQMRAGQEGMLTGEAANQAGAFRIERQIVIPQGLMAMLGDAVEAVATAVMQGRSEG